MVVVVEEMLVVAFLMRLLITFTVLEETLIINEQRASLLECLFRWQPSHGAQHKDDGDGWVQCSMVMREPDGDL